MRFKPLPEKNQTKRSKRDGHDDARTQISGATRRALSDLRTQDEGQTEQATKGLRGLATQADALAAGRPGITEAGRKVAESMKKQAAGAAEEVKSSVADAVAAVKTTASGDGEPGANGSVSGSQFWPNRASVV